MTTDEETKRTLNRIAAILQIAYRSAIDEAGAEILSDDTNRAILAVTSEWIATGALQEAAVKQGAASERTVFRRLADLVDRGFLERRGSTPNVEYRNSGLI